MKKLATVVLAVSCISGVAMAASPECEIQADVTWMEQSAFEQKAETLGYTIDRLEVSDGNCYQLTGQNRDGVGVIAFFNPQTGDVVQEDVAQ